jgi:hypothetical protein
VALFLRDSAVAPAVGGRLAHYGVADLVQHATAQQAHTLGVSVSKLLRAYGNDGAIEVLDAANSSSRDVRASWFTLRSLLNTPLAVTDTKIARLRSGRPVARLVGLQAPDRAAVAFSPVVIERQLYGAVLVSQLAVRRSELLSWHTERALTTAAALLAISWLWASLIGLGWVARPVNQLVEQAVRIGKGTLVPRSSSAPGMASQGSPLPALADESNPVAGRDVLNARVESPRGRANR